MIVLAGTMITNSLNTSQVTASFEKHDLASLASNVLVSCLSSSFLSLFLFLFTFISCPSSLAHCLFCCYCDFCNPYRDRHGVRLKIKFLAVTDIMESLMSNVNAQTTSLYLKLKVCWKYECFLYMVCIGQTVYLYFPCQTTPVHMCFANGFIYEFDTKEHACIFKNNEKQARTWIYVWKFHATIISRGASHV